MWKLWHKHQIPAEFRDYDSVSGRTASPTQLCTHFHTHRHMWTHILPHSSNLQFFFGLISVTCSLHFSGQFLVLLLSLFVPSTGNCPRTFMLSAFVLLFEWHFAYIIHNQTDITTPDWYVCDCASSGSGGSLVRFAVQIVRGNRKWSFLLIHSFSFVCLSKWKCVDLQAAQLPFVCVFAAYCARLRRGPEYSKPGSEFSQHLKH